MPTTDSSTEELQEWLTRDQPREAVAATRELVRREAREALPLMRTVFETTEQVALRNALALALTDLHDPDALELIVKAIRRLDTNRGTLLYSLRNYNCTRIFPLLVELVIGGNFEESREAMNLTDTVDEKIDRETFERCRSRVKDAMATASDERRSVLEELLSSFIVPPKTSRS
jgi:hypothetical protein